MANIDFNRMKYLFEKFINEQEAVANATTPADPNATAPAGGSDEETIKKTISGDYASFVNYFKSTGNDPKVINFLNKGGVKDKFTVNNAASIAVNKLKPTQNEIDVNKSLWYPLNKAQQFQQFVTNPQNIKINNTPILTFNGQYIIDGHHRWSQVYAINPNATMEAIDLQNAELAASPLDVLKATQMSILALTKKLPTASAKGTNLLTIDYNTLFAYISKTVVKEVMNVFNLYKAKLNIQSAQPQQQAQAAPVAEAQVNANTAKPLADYIWGNVSQMKQTSQPVAGAPKRDFMPQTDAGTTPAAVAAKMASDAPPDTKAGGFHTDQQKVAAESIRRKKLMESKNKKYFYKK